MPRAIVAANELHELAIATDQKVRRHAQFGDRREIRMCMRVEAVRKQLYDALAAEFAGRQRDSVHDDKVDRQPGRPRIAIGRADSPCGCRIAGSIDREPSMQ